MHLEVDEIDQEVSRLDLTNKQLTVASIMRNFPNLIELNLSRNLLVEFRLPACYKSLKILDLSYNHLTAIPLWFFSKRFCVKLEVLNLSYNPLFKEHHLHYTFNPSATITYLNLSNTGLSNKNLCMLKYITGLKKLDISTYINVPPYTGNSFVGDINPHHLPPTLEELIAQDVNLTQPPDLSKFTSLRVLDLSRNTFRAFYRDFPKLENLQKLILQDCSLCFVQENFGLLANLLHLDLSHNLLNSLPESFSKFPSLKYLDLYDNNFESVPQCLDELMSLEKLDLAQNFFKVPDCGTRDYLALQENLRNSMTYPCDRLSSEKKIDEEMTSHCMYFEREMTSHYSGSEEEDYWLDSIESAEDNRITAEEENQEEEAWGEVECDYTNQTFKFSEDSSYDSDDSLDKAIAYCPPALRQSENFFVPALSHHMSKEDRKALKRAMEANLPPSVPGQFDDA